MTALTIPAYAAIRFDVPATIILEGPAMTKVLDAIPPSELVEAFEMLPAAKQDDILQSILTDKSVEWMLSETVRRIKASKTDTEAATLRAIVEAVQAVAELANDDGDEDCAEALRQIREAVKHTPTEGAQA